MSKVEALFLFGFLAVGFLCWGLFEWHFGEATMLSLRTPSSTVHIAENGEVFLYTMYGKVMIGALCLLFFFVTLFQKGGK